MRFFKKIFNSKKLIALGLFFLTMSKVFFAFNFSNQQSTIRFNKTNSKFILDTALSGFEGMLDLKDNVAATISGSNITFSGGVLKTGSTTSIFNGTFNPTTTDKFTLGNGDYMDVKSGSVLQAIEVAATSTATIFGEPIFSSAISLLAATSTLNLAITTPLNYSVTGLGTLALLSNLKLGRSVQVPSLVSLNGKRLTFDGGTISSASTITGNGSIDILGYTALSVLLTIGSGADVVYFNGNGCVVDLSATGGITFNGTTMYLNDIHLSGVSTTNPLNGTGTIYLSNVTIELGGDFVRSDGPFYVFGDGCKLVTNGYTFTMSGAGNDLTVDGVTLYFEQISGSGANPFSAVSSAAINYLNNGSIISAFGNANENITVTGTSWALSKDFFLSGATKIYFNNATPLVPKAVTFDGVGQFVSFPYKVSTYITLQANEQVTFSNIVFKNFYPAVYSIGANSTISYGDGVRLELGPDLVIASGDPAWVFTGDAEIDGNGAALKIDKAQGITLSGANKVLSLTNMRLIVSTVDALKVLTDSAKLRFKNVELILLDAGFNLSAGNMEIEGLLKISGGAMTVSPVTTFEISSTGSCIINANAQMFVDRNVILKYNADPTNDGSFSATKRHIVMTNSNSVLNLCGCTLMSTATGVGFDTGTLQIQDKVTLLTNTAAGAEAEFGSGLIVNLSSGAVLDVNGSLRYIV